MPDHPSRGGDDLQDLRGAGLDDRRNRRAGLGRPRGEDALLNDPQDLTSPVGIGEALVGIGEKEPLPPWGLASENK